MIAIFRMPVEVDYTRIDDRDVWGNAIFSLSSSPVLCLAVG
jgi:hypothetical protein